MLKALKELWGGKGGGASQEEVIELTNQFYVTLRAYFAKVQQERGPNDPVRSQPAFQRVQEILKPDVVQSWTAAYEAEQMLVHLFGESAIATELAVRTLEAKSVLRTELASAYTTELGALAEQRKNLQLPNDESKLAAIEDRQRTILGRLINDLQWRYIVNEATRRYSKLVTRRTAILSSLALVTFLVLVGAIWEVRLDFLRGLRLLLVAGLSGFWGATFSMLVTLKSRLGASTFDDLKLMKAFPVLISRALIGASAACILFLFLLSGLLSGTAFPQLTPPNTSRGAQSPGGTPGSPGSPPAGNEPLPRDDGAAGTQGSVGERADQSAGAAAADSVRLDLTQFALLVVWCFIAGFSEQLVPTLLASTESRAGGAPTGSERVPPAPGTTPVPPPPAPRVPGREARKPSGEGESGAGAGAAPETPPAE